MRNLFIWIPEFFKGMLEVMKETQERAGGGWKGQFVFWIVFFLFLVFSVVFFTWVSKYAYGNFTEFLSYFNITITHVDVTIPSSVFTNLLLSLLVTVLYFIVLIGFAGIMGAFIGMLTNSIFPAFTTYRIDKVFTDLLPVLKRTDEINHTDETERMLGEVTRLNERWNKSRATRISRFLTAKRNREKFDKVKLSQEVKK